MNQEVTPLLLKYKAQWEKNPRSQVFAPLAELYRKMDMIDEAMRVLKLGIRHHPNYIAGYLSLANCYFDINQFPMCYATLRPLVENQRDNLRLQNLFARVCLELGNLEEALDSYKYLLFLNPKDKAIALKVRELEDRLEAPKRPPLREEQVVFQTQNIFAEEAGELDEWQQVNFSGRSPAVVEESWIISDKLEEDQVIQFESSLDEAGMTEIDIPPQMPKKDESTMLQFHRKDEKKQQEHHDDEEDLVDEKVEKTTDLPLVTHTLVDLYCKQGHYRKAIEILDKILELNPSDQRSIARKREVLELQKKADQDLGNNGEEELLAALDIRRAEEQEATTVKKIRKLEAFLQLVQAKKEERIRE